MLKLRDSVCRGFSRNYQNFAGGAIKECKCTIVQREPILSVKKKVMKYVPLIATTYLTTSMKNASIKQLSFIKIIVSNRSREYVPLIATTYLTTSMKNASIKQLSFIKIIVSNRSREFWSLMKTKYSVLRQSRTLL
ncbi:hypothetical protein BpHYR1_002954 [Brachionus plicatilis]|uniref:Uncharacterized protein n=1 Tax=Brachionus plicatilis TaxID=10195 RepID=A0A3M7R6G2_BRAPC|nr:hypothetical protein BpHYR1_002954 [Brachionus plicatilis]